jgi:glucosamine--fructose-6-phosphate aminotransferase (isomerizing)
VGARSGGVELVGPWRWSGPEGPRTAPAAFTPRWRPEDVTLGAHRDFMAKEIGEQSTVAARIVDEYADGIVDGSLWRGLGLPALERVRVLGCGTSLYAGMVVACALRTVGALPVRTVVASEAGDDLVEPGTITLAISQSGETADVLRALERRAGGPVLAMTTNVHSTLFRTADAAVDCLSGPEIGVAATKTFTAQVLTGVALTLSGLVFSGRLEPERARRIVALLADMPQRLAAANDIAAQVIPDVVGSLTEAPGFLFLGRGSSLPYAAEGALKLQEITYRWAHAYPAGELKHGPIALIEEGTPVIAIDDGNPRLRANLSEVAARGARVIEIGGPQSTLPLLETTYASPPWGPLEAVVGLQQLARSLAIALGRDVDKPRNLAKSVTVE